MAKIRYVKTPEELRKAAEQNPEFLPSSMRQIRAVYRTDPDIVAAVLPRPLEPCGRGEVGVTISDVTMHLQPGIDVTIGAAIFGVQAVYEGVEGLYLLTMPMTTEGAVVGGRETFGEPKKLADIDFRRDRDEVVASVARQGIQYIEIRASVGEDLGARDWTTHAYCFKAMPSCEPDRLFDHDPLLVRLEWHHEMKSVHQMSNAQIVLRESPFDPVADLPVQEIVSIQYEEGSTRSNGRVLRSVPGDWLAPYLHQRYDDTVSIMEQMLGTTGEAGAAAG